MLNAGAMIAFAYLSDRSPSLIAANHKGVDLRNVGSGNTGATNVGRAQENVPDASCFCSMRQKVRFRSPSLDLLRLERPPISSLSAPGRSSSGIVTRSGIAFGGKAQQPRSAF
ncbi:MAG: hypothetical protein R3A47_04205 [Polyangiales bacterium]